MSEATDRMKMRTVLAGHALVGVPEVGAFLGVDREVAAGIVARKEIPSIKVGARRKVDPIDVAVYVLAGREGISPADYWKAHGEATGEHARRYFRTLERWQAA